MIIIQQTRFRDRKKGWTMYLFEVAIELTLGVKLTITPKSPLCCDIGLGLIRLTFSITKDRYTQNLQVL